ncbi:MAG: protein kinase, partial [Planctomycetota bacterium]
MMEPGKGVDHEKLKDLFLEDMGLLPPRDPDQRPAERLGSMQVLGRYLLIEELGSGASGRVFSAMHQELKKKVALKIFSTAPGEPKPSVDRFRREAVLAASLRHPNLVSVHDIGTEGAYRYIAMDLVEGVTLDLWLKNGAVSMPRRLEVMEKIANAVSHSHDKGIIHRDLKPRNILITPEGEPIVVDFGLARPLFDNRRTRDGTVIGTPPYMAPEQLRGATSTLDKRTDLFALGVLLYEMVTSTLPFQGETSEEIHHNILNRKLVPPGRLCSNLPGNLEAVIFKALDPDPELRYQNGESLAEDLARLRAGDLAVHVDSTLHLHLKRLATRTRRHPLIAALSLLTLAVVFWGGSSLSEHWDKQRRIERALSIETAYNQISQQLEPLFELAEEQRYSLSIEKEKKQATLKEIERSLDRLSDDTGVSDAFQFLLHDLLNNPDASDLYTRARNEHPDNPILPLMKGRAFLRQLAESSPWPGANGVRLYNTPSTYFPMEDQVQNQLMELLAEAQKEFHTAQTLCDSMPLTAFHWLNALSLAYLDLSQGKIADAIDRLKALQGVEELCLEIYIPLTLAYWTCQDYENAVKTAESFARLRPDLIPAKDTLASCYMHLGYSVINQNPKQAVNCFLDSLKVIESVPDDYMDKSRKIGTLYLALCTAWYPKKPEYLEYARTAESYFTDRIENGNAAFLDYYNRGVANKYQEDSASQEMALQDFEHARSLNPQHPLCHLMVMQARIVNLATLYKNGTLQSEDFEAARRDLESLEKIWPDSVESSFCQAQVYHIQAGYILSQGEDPDRALTVYKTAFRLVSEIIGRRPDLGQAHALKMGAWVAIAQIEGISFDDLNAFIGYAMERWNMGCKFALPPFKSAKFVERMVKKPPHCLSLKSIALLLKTHPWFIPFQEPEKQAGFKADAVRLIENLIRYSYLKEPEEALSMLRELWNWAPSQDSDAIADRLLYRLEALCVDPEIEEAQLSDMLDEIERIAACMNDMPKKHLFLARTYELLGAYRPGDQGAEVYEKTLVHTGEALASDPHCDTARLINDVILRSGNPAGKKRGPIPAIDLNSC